MPIHRVILSELISLKLVKDKSRKEKAVDNIDINTASFDFSLPLNLKIE